MARTAHEFTPRPAAQLSDAQLKQRIEASCSKLLLAMCFVMLLALAYAKLIGQAAPGAAQQSSEMLHSRYDWHESDTVE